MDNIYHFFEQYLLIISLIISSLSAFTILFGAFLHYREENKLALLSFAEPFARKCHNFLTFQTDFPGKRYPSFIPEGEKAEFDFYTEFSRVLSEAKIEIFNSGDGFNMTSPSDGGGRWTSREKADTLDRAIVHAMTENPLLVYTRFQILAACNINWVSRMIFLKEKFGAKFRVYVNRDFDHMGCFCVVDSGSKNCVFEWQLVSGRRRARGTVSKGFGFIYKNKEICRVVKTMFKEIKEAYATNYLAIDPDKADGLSVESLRMLQKQLWDHEVKMIHMNSNYTLIDDEITQAFIARDLDKKKFKVADMDFRPEEFPPISLD